jgi:DNA phosphorothioation-associated putative methyltransferase
VITDPSWREATVGPMHADIPIRSMKAPRSRQTAHTCRPLGVRPKILIKLQYPDFATDPHPALQRSVKLSLRTRGIDCFDYTASANPLILHRKESFLTADHPLHAKFARLSQQEEKHGLLDDTATIGTKVGWQARLDPAGFVLRGHRLVRR